MSDTDPKLQCPSHYPVGCLLGCVDLTDCLAQDEYREKVRMAFHAPNGNLFSRQFIHLNPPPPPPPFFLRKKKKKKKPPKKKKKKTN